MNGVKETGGTKTTRANIDCNPRGDAELRNKATC